MTSQARHKTEAISHPVFVRATGPGTGGIATLVLDGWGLAARLQPLLKSWKKVREAEPGELFFARLTDGAGKIVDEVVVAFLDFKETETGHEQIELSCHGGEGAVSAVEAALLSAGIARGDGNELLRRAHFNGKLSLVAVEARLRLARAATARQAEFLLSHSAFQQRWERLGFEIATGLREQNLAWRENLFATASEADARIPASLALLATHSIAITGPVNAGKSTLANLLARAERYIVSAVPGTTRDRLDTRLALRGLDVVLTDTAGLRETADDLEQEGQRRAGEAARAAALRLLLLDGSRPPEESDLKMIAECTIVGPTLLVLNKHDLGLDESAAGLGFLAGQEPCSISARTGFGLDKLEEAIESRLLGGAQPMAGDPFTERQARRIQELMVSFSAGSTGNALLGHIRKLIGTRPDVEELKAVFSEQ